MLAPAPSARGEPSTWYADTAAPQRNPSGKGGCVTRSGGQTQLGRRVENVHPLRLDGQIETAAGIRNPARSELAEKRLLPDVPVDDDLVSQRLDEVDLDRDARREGARLR